MKWTWCPDCGMHIVEVEDGEQIECSCGESFTAGEDTDIGGR